MHRSTDMLWFTYTAVLSPVQSIAVISDMQALQTCDDTDLGIVSLILHLWGTGDMLQALLVTDVTTLHACQSTGAVDAT